MPCLAINWLLEKLGVKTILRMMAMVMMIAGCPLPMITMMTMMMLEDEDEDDDDDDDDDVGQGVMTPFQSSLDAD